MDIDQIDSSVLALKVADWNLSSDFSFCIPQVVVHFLLIVINLDGV
jgi:hypothetical protein